MRFMNKVARGQVFLLVLRFLPVSTIAPVFHSGVPRNFVRGGSTNSVEDRENGDLGVVAP